MKLTFEEGQHLSILLIEDDEGEIFQIGTCLNDWADRLTLKEESPCTRRVE